MRKIQMTTYQCKEYIDIFAKESIIREIDGVNLTFRRLEKGWYANSTLMFEDEVAISSKIFDVLDCDYITFGGMLASTAVKDYSGYVIREHANNEYLLNLDNYKNADEYLSALGGADT